jgi:hypothetical protein
MFGAMKRYLEQNPFKGNVENVDVSNKGSKRPTLPAASSVQPPLEFEHSKMPATTAAEAPANFDPVIDSFPFEMESATPEGLAAAAAAFPPIGSNNLSPSWEYLLTGLISDSPNQIELKSSSNHSAPEVVNESKIWEV